MLGAAKAIFRRSVSFDGKSSIADHAASARRQMEARGVRIEITEEPPEMPDWLSHVWDIFMQISRRRQMAQYGPQPITLTEIVALETLLRWRLEPYEVELICLLDDEFLAAFFDNMKKQQQHQRGRQLPIPGTSTKPVLAR